MILIAGLVLLLVGYLTMQCGNEIGLEKTRFGVTTVTIAGLLIWLLGLGFVIYSVGNFIWRHFA